MAIGGSEAETFWTEFLRKLTRRGLRGVKLVISDAHEGLKAAIAKVLNATWQRCRVHTMRNLLAHASRQGRGLAAAFIATIFAQEDAEAAKAQWRKVADQLRDRVPGSGVRAVVAITSPASLAGSVSGHGGQPDEGIIAQGRDVSRVM